MKWMKLILLCSLGLLLLLAAGCSATQEPCPECPTTEAISPAPTQEPLPTTEPCPTSAPACAPCPECPPATTGRDAGEPQQPSPVTFEERWANSAHANVEAEAFTHWNGAEPPVIPAGCAKCHSQSGYVDFLGADGTQPRVVNADAPPGTPVTCAACHNGAAVAWDTVVFPSGAVVTDLGVEARCMECHQGRASAVSVDDSIAAAGLADDDTVSEDLDFTNIHYYAAAATMYGALAQGGYEYPGKAYDAKHDHVPGMDTCVDCHDAHSLELKLDRCSTCHTGVETREDLRNNRMMGSLEDYDGDGDTGEGIYYEIQGLQGMLYQAIQAYASEVAGTPIVYHGASYPYFFVDTDGNGEVEEGEASYDNRYNAWTGRLAKAAYNLQTSVQDPGAYAHGGKYMIQLLYDSIEDLNQAIAVPTDLSTASRIDHKHFAGSETAFRNWDQEGVVPRHCSRCHSAIGLPLYVTEGASVAQQPTNGLNCATCHDSLPAFSVYQVPSVTFPRGTIVDSGDPNTNLCLNCHQGLSSIATVNAAIAGRDLDTPADDLEFISIHNLVAGATLYGTEVQGAYEYADKDYAGRLAHVDAYKNCTQCHDIHRQQVEVSECGACHPGVSAREDLDNIRVAADAVDFDGDGDAAEGIAGEVEGLRLALFKAIQDYARDVAGAAIVYQSHTSPYFFADSNDNGEADPDEIAGNNAYASWTPRMVRATYNFHYATRDPGAFAHNPDYVIQVLYDSIEDMKGNVTALSRP